MNRTLKLLRMGGRVAEAEADTCEPPRTECLAPTYNLAHRMQCPNHRPNQHQSKIPQNLKLGVVTLLMRE
jgi:hypothetical protein